MKRRNFLKGIVGVGASIVTAPVIAKIEPKVSEDVPYDYFESPHISNKSKLDKLGLDVDDTQYIRPAAVVENGHLSYSSNTEIGYSDTNTYDEKDNMYKAVVDRIIINEPGIYTYHGKDLIKINDKFDEHHWFHGQGNGQYMITTKFEKFDIIYMTRTDQHFSIQMT